MLRLLKELCLTNGVSGFETPIRAKLAEKCRPYADEMSVDTMGNLIVEQSYPEAVEMFFNIFSQQGNPTESNLIEMENIYRFKVKNTQKADSVHQIIMQKYPDGWTVRRQAFMDLMKAGDQWHQRSVELLTKWPSQQSAKLDAYQPYIYYNAYRALGSDYFTGKYDQQELIRMIPDMDFKTLAELYRTTCGAFHTKKAASDDLNLPVAKALIGEMQKKLTDGSYCEGIYLSPSQSDFLARRLLDEHLGNYADILLCKGQPAEALVFLPFVNEGKGKGSQIVFRVIESVRGTSDVFFHDRRLPPVIIGSPAPFVKAAAPEEPPRAQISGDFVMARPSAL